MIACSTDVQFFASITLGRSSNHCCHSDASRMPGAFSVNHPVRHHQSGPNGRSEHHEQTRY